jgi:DNA repair exonuclease SbcCD ATPase subunit
MSCVFETLEDHDKNLIESEKQKLENITTGIIELIKDNKSIYESISLDIKKYNEAKSKIDSKIQSIQNQKNNISYLQRNIDEIQKTITQYQDDVVNIKNENNSFDKLISETLTKVEEIKKEIDSLKKIINLMDVVKFVVSEEGVKSFIVKKILTHFNSKLTYFLKKLDSNCVCVFNEYFEEEIVNEKGKICLYNNFSGAERKAIDLACLFSFMDMRKAQGDVYYNISFYDELFDSSLDEKGVDLVLEILNERVQKYNECVMIISHRKESIKSANGDIIFLEKHNGITRRINFVD